MRTSSTFGAASGGMTVGGQPGWLSTRFGWMKPWKGGVGVGSTLLSGNSTAVGDCARADVRKPTAPSAAASAPLADDRNNCRLFILLITLLHPRTPPAQTPRCLRH